MIVELIDPPGAAEPFIVVQGHEDAGGPGPHDVPAQQTRLSLAEAAELARMLTDLVATARAPGKRW